MWRRAFLLSPLRHLRVPPSRPSRFLTTSHASNPSPQTTPPRPSTPPRSPIPPKSRRMSEDIKEYTAASASGTPPVEFDLSLLPATSAPVFPRIKTTSLSTKRVVIHDEAHNRPVTLVLVAFRSFADSQLCSWRSAFSTLPDHQAQWFDVTVNESFAAQALSGFIQRWQRGRTDPALHDFYVAFNSKAREPLEDLLLSSNRMYGYVLLLDSNSRVRFRASGLASAEGSAALMKCAQEIIMENSSTDDDKPHTSKA